jgi:hypothetical protein
MGYYTGEFKFKTWGGRQWEEKTIVRIIIAENVNHAQHKGETWWTDLEEIRRGKSANDGIHYEPNTLINLEVSEPIQ